MTVPRFRHQPGRGSGEIGGELSDLDCRGERRHVFGIDFALDPADLKERDERDDAGDERKDDGRSETGRDLNPEAPAHRKLPSKPADLLRGRRIGDLSRLVGRPGIGALRFPAAFVVGKRRFPGKGFAERPRDRKAARLFRVLGGFRPGFLGYPIPLGIRRTVLPVLRLPFGHPVT